MDGTFGILLAWNDEYTWEDCLIFASLFCQNRNPTYSGECLPEEQQNWLADYFLPV